jgi:predicted kinase
VIRSDEIRKRLSGVPPHQRLGAEGYSQEMSQRVYATVVSRARAAVLEGHSVIVDAVFGRPADREAVERAASDMSVPFVGIWLEAPEPVLVARTEQRRNDASDANADVIRMQLRQQTGAVTWHRIEASTTADDVLAHARNYIDLPPSSASRGLSGDVVRGDEG